MSSRSTVIRQASYILLTVAVVLFALPQSWRSGLPGVFGSADFRLGLDLAGGTQLDFRISEAEIDAQENALREEIATAKAAGTDPEHVLSLENALLVLQGQRTNLVEAIRTVLERRINGLGVSEATITPSTVGNEKHLLVECPGVVDVQECIQTVGKTIQLEFKEEQTEATPEFEREVRAEVADAESKLNKQVTTLEKLGQDIGSQLGNAYQPGDWYTRDTLPKGLEPLWSGRTGVVRRYQGSVSQQTFDDKGQPVTIEVPAIFLAELLTPKTQTGRVLQEASAAFTTLQTQEQGLKAGSKELVDASTLPSAVQGTLAGMQRGELKAVDLGDGTAQLVFLRQLIPGQEQMDASHILVAYKGASGTDASITRTKEEAKARAEDVLQKLKSGGDFAALAAQYSDAESKTTGGKLGSIARGVMMAAFETPAFALKQGEISSVVETDFGFHVIRSDRAPYDSPSKVSLETLTVSGEGAKARAEGIITRLQNGEVTRMEDAIRVRFLLFSLKPAGWKDTPLDGKHFRSAIASADQTTNLPIVQITFDSEGAKLFQELTRTNVGKKLAIFVGGELISAPTVQGEIAGGSAVITGSATFQEAQRLAQDLNTGAIPAPIHLTGQHTVEPTLGAEALRTSLHAGVIGAIIVMLFLILVYRALGVLGSLSLLAYAAIFLALLKLPLFLVTGQYVVLTLAGIAGMILSIGLAVDANVLIFERMKEEIAKGRGFKQAVELGFERAWPSIRDSNISTLITCAILFTIGTSIVRGFAVTLSVGVVISLFTGMVLTRRMAMIMARMKLSGDKRFFLWNTGKPRE